MAKRDDYYDYDDGLTKEQRRKKRVKKRKRQILLLRISVSVCAVFVLVLGFLLADYFIKKNGGGGIFPLRQSADTLSPAGGGAAAEGASGTLSAAEDPAPEDGADTNIGAAADAGAGGEAEGSADGSGDAADFDGTDGGDAADAGDAPADAADQAAGQAAPGSAEAEAALAEARLLAAGYDYDGAIARVSAVPGYEADPALTSAIADFEAVKETCTPVDVTTVPHIFYHSLINDTDRAFNVEVLGQSTVDGMNAWMTTIEEFDRITQQLYDNGYVYVRLRDLVTTEYDADGTPHFSPSQSLMLPPGKKAIVLSVDDLAYYHSYKPAGFPEKLVLDDQGLVKCRYEDASGNVQIGDFDVVPRLNTFLRGHPDGAYHGARGLIALTGYNGVFGYRTDIDYEVREHLVADQAAWLEDHPDFDRGEDIAQATVIADAIRSEGWEFASHTWGHISVTGAEADKLLEDNEKWVNNVQNIVGPTDTIIFAHGNDIGDWQGYASDNPKYAAYRSAGYYFYCNVDGSVPYWVQITSDYVRQGRINMDGYMLYQASTGQTDVLNQLIDPVSVFDSRRPTPVVANGQG